MNRLVAIWRSRRARCACSCTAPARGLARSSTAARAKEKTMSENQQPNHDLLEEAIHAFQRMSVPERPLDAEVLAQYSSRRGDLSQPSSITIPSKRRYRMHLIVSSAAAAVLLFGGLLLFLRNS